MWFAPAAGPGVDVVSNLQAQRCVQSHPNVDPRGDIATRVISHSARWNEGCIPKRYEGVNLAARGAPPKVIGKVQRPKQSTFMELSQLRPGWFDFKGHSLM